VFAAARFSFLLVEQFQTEAGEVVILVGLDRAVHLEEEVLVVVLLLLLALEVLLEFFNLILVLVIFCLDSGERVKQRRHHFDAAQLLGVSLH